MSAPGINKATSYRQVPKPLLSQFEKVTGMVSGPQNVIETFENPYPARDYVIETVCPEFTSVCPKTGQPDFGTLTITYVADAVCFELKSLKLYLQQYRNHGAFYERVTNQILDDLVAAVKPRWMTLKSEWTPRGGIRTNVLAEYVSDGEHRRRGTSPSIR